MGKAEAHINTLLTESFNAQNSAKKYKTSYVWMFIEDTEKNRKVFKKYISGRDKWLCAKKEMDTQFKQLITLESRDKKL